MIVLTAEEMRSIPQVIVIPYGLAKAPALRAALRSGLVGGIVTHTALAQAVLDQSADDAGLEGADAEGERR